MGAETVQQSRQLGEPQRQAWSKPCETGARSSRRWHWHGAGQTEKQGSEDGKRRWGGSDNRA